MNELEQGFDRKLWLVCSFIAARDFRPRHRSSTWDDQIITDRQLNYLDCCKFVTILRGNYLRDMNDNGPLLLKFAGA